MNIMLQFYVIIISQRYNIMIANLVAVNNIIKDFFNLNLDEFEANFRVKKGFFTGAKKTIEKTHRDEILSMIRRVVHELRSHKEILRKEAKTKDDKFYLVLAIGFNDIYAKLTDSVNKPKISSVFDSIIHLEVELNVFLSHKKFAHNDYYDNISSLTILFDDMIKVRKSKPKISWKEDIVAEEHGHDVVSKVGCFW